MSLTLGLTGMDPATEAALKATFLEANARLGGRWSLVSDAEAGHVVVDMDSMYGPMSWLRLHAAGRQVVGLTSAPRTQTDYRLGRPFDTAQLAALLADIAQGAGIDLAPAQVDVAEVQAEPDAVELRGAAVQALSDAGALEAESPVADAQGADQLDADQLDAAALDAGSLDADPLKADSPGSEPLDAGSPGADTPTTGPLDASPLDPTSPVPPPPDVLPDAPLGLAGAMPLVASAAGPEQSQPEQSQPEPTERTLAVWLARGALQGPVRYRRSSGPTLLIDPGTETWHGPTPLKPIAPYFEGHIDQADFEAMDPAEWARESASAGPAQPLTRLRWLGGLVAGGGRLLPGVDPEGRFQLVKWPQTEREYPRHFRIATQMMRGPATVDEIAAASGVPAPDVADFVNANLATGFAEPVVEAPAAPEEPARPRGGLLGRLRNR